MLASRPAHERGGVGDRAFLAFKLHRFISGAGRVPRCAARVSGASPSTASAFRRWSAQEIAGRYAAGKTMRELAIDYDVGEWWWSLEVLDRLTPEYDTPTAMVGRAS
jgi:hypothetical protein